MFLIPSTPLYLILACLIRFFNNIGFILIGLSSNEFYPTVVRTVGSGLTFTAGITGATVATLVINACENSNINPFIPLGLLGLSGVIGGLLISETVGKPMRDHIEPKSPEVEIKEI